MTIIKYNANDVVTSDHYGKGLWDKECIGVAAETIKDTDIVLDIGANVGVFSLNVAEKKKCKIYAFEPIKQTYDRLTENIKENKAVGITPINKGMSLKNEKLPMYFTDSWSAKSSMRNISADERAYQVECEFVKMDDFCHREGIKPNFIKCDVEGAELLVFQGGREIIKECLPIIMCEIYEPWITAFGYSPVVLKDYLRELGYSWFTVKEGEFTPEESGVAAGENNFWAIPRKV